MVDQNKNTNMLKKSPLWFRTLNKAWQFTYPVGTTITLNKDSLIRAARKATGLTNLGSEFWDEPLEVLIRSINKEAFLHPAGRFISRQRMINLLCTRLRAEEMFRRFPEILQLPLYPAWIIVGLQRTGTTKLQRLLAADTDHRLLRSWEAINPAPWKMDQGKRDKRIAAALTSVKAVKLIAPEFFAIHPIGHELPEEDILLLDVSFLSTTPEATMNVPSYASWLEKTDQSYAYAYEVKLLKLLQWQQPGKRWILKSPHHLEFPDSIEKHFGEIRFLWTHRSVYESIPSFLSMVAASRAIFSDHIEIPALTRHWLRKSGYMLDKMIAYRRKPGNEKKFTDIFYQEAVADPISGLRRIYAKNGGLPEGLITRFEHTDRQNPFRKYGVHHYSLNDFGLTGKDIEEVTRSYQDFLITLTRQGVDPMA
jgi:hypothetical protein